MKKSIALILVLVSSQIIYGQVQNLSGYVKDSVQFRTQSALLVYLLRTTDSTIYKFTRTDRSGRFTFKDIQLGEYLISVYSDLYEDFIKSITIPELPLEIIELDDIYLLPRGKKLQAITVFKKLSIVRMKGDTTEFLVDSIKLSQYANVEDLLRLMPGLEVDKDGKITAQGQVVQNILVDGNEFFSEDPALVTKNLHASMIEKIQLYEAKSKQEAFSGIEDGKRKTTLNLKLKQNSKNGYFGKAEFGIGSDQFYQGQGMFNDFLNKMKFAVYGNVGNANLRNINLDDQNYQFDNATVHQDNDLELWNGNYDNHGIPNLKSVGAHYNNSFHDEGQLISCNYNFSNLNVGGQNSSLSNQILPGSSFSNSSTEIFYNKDIQNKLSTHFENQITNTTRIEGALSELLESKEINSQFQDQTFLNNGASVNNGTRDIAYKGDKTDFSAQFLLLHKFEKSKNTISLNFDFGRRQSNYSGFLNANTLFSNLGNSNDSEQVINQYKVDSVNNRRFNSKVIFTSQISSGFKFLSNYSFGYSEGKVQKSAFDYSNGLYNKFDTLNSNNSDVKSLTQKIGIAFTNVYKKLILDWGTDIGTTNILQNNLYQKNILNQKYLTWYPAADFKYRFSQQNIILFSYEGNPTFPTIQQLIPSYRNEDPLNLYLGNPALLPSYTHSFRLLYRNFKIATNRTILLNSTYSIATNPITVNTNTDSLGESIIQSVNIHNANAKIFYLYVLYSMKITNLDFNLIFDGGLKSNIQSSIINSIVNQTETNEYHIGFGFNKYRKSIYEFALNFKEVYNISFFSLQGIGNNGYWSTRAMLYFDYLVFRKYEINSTTVFNHQEQSKYFGASLNQVLCNAWIGRHLFSSGSVLLKFSVNDLFNQNIGFNRVISNNLLAQNSYTTIKRYLMFSISWNFIKQKN